jgi:plastocyanin
MRRLGLALALVTLVACGSTSTPTVAPGAVLVANFAFSPDALTVHAGDTVTWVFDQPGVPHNVYSTGGPVHFESLGYQSTGTFHFTFTQLGTYTYVCQIHPNMVGTVVVK